MENFNVTNNLGEVKEERILEIQGRSFLGLCPVLLLVLIIILRMSWTLYRSFGQKTRSPQQRRMYAGSRPRQSLGAQEPTIYVSPSNLPPPPKYEFMAPPSYEEVVGIHYPNYAVQPIAQPINNALAQGSSNTPTVTITNNTTDNDSTNNAPATVTVTTEVRRNSVTPART